MLVHINRHFKHITIWHFVALILAIHMFNTPFVSYPSLVAEGPTWLGLDVSWQMTLNYALIKGWVWGKDIVYTYGPLGFLATRIGLGVSRWLYVCFDLFLICNFFYVFKDFLLQATNKFLATVVLFCATLLITPNYGSGLGWVLLILIYYWLYKSYVQQKALYFIILSVLITLSFLIKLNSGLIGYVFFVAHLLNLYIIKKNNLSKTVLYAAIPIALIFASSIPLKVALPEYIKGATELIKGYNDVMFFAEHANQSVETYIAILFWSITVLFIILLVILIRGKAYHQLFFVAINLIYVFLLRKQAIIRNDMQHLTEFLHFAPLVLISGNLLFFKNKIQDFILGSTVLIVFAGLLFLTEHYPLSYSTLRYRSQLDYRKIHKGYNLQPFLYQKDKRYIPQHILDRIGNNTTDIFPWDSEYLIENNLNYHPRPVFQSFTAYTEYLQTKNYNFYSKKGPAYIIYDYDAIDNRSAINDEPLVNLYIAKNYVVADTFHSNERWRLLLQKKDTVAPIEINKIREGIYNITDEIPVAGVSFVKIYMEYSLKGRMNALWEHPSEILISATGENGHTTVHKTSKELLKAGTYVEKQVTSTEQFASFVMNKQTVQDQHKIQLRVNKDMCKQKIKVEFFKID